MDAGLKKLLEKWAEARNAFLLAEDEYNIMQGDLAELTRRKNEAKRRRNAAKDEFELLQGHLDEVLSVVGVPIESAT